MALREAMMGDEFPVVGDGGMGGGDIDVSGKCFLRVTGVQANFV